MAARQRPFSDQLRRAIDECEESRYRIWQETGVDQGTISRFMHGQNGMTIATVDKLVKYLDLELRRRKER